MNKCQKCGKNSEKEYCFKCNPRKPLNKNKSLSSKPKERDNSEEYKYKELFLSIWNKRPHKSEIDGSPIYGEPLSIYFHHILPKNKYPEACLDEENIIILTWEQHQTVENDMYKYEKINQLREKLLKKYGYK